MSNWFYELFGFDEMEHDVYEKLVIKENKLTSLVNNKSYDIGQFECVNIRDLWEDNYQNPKMIKNSLIVTTETGDISEIMNRSENKNAVFQVASQFNCLEMSGPSIIPEDGVTRYANDRTQGPCCAISAGPATVYRNYFAPVTEKEGFQTGQSNDKQICNIDDLLNVICKIDDDNIIRRDFNTQNGYTITTDNCLKKMNPIILKNYKMLSGYIKVGIHSNIQVTCKNWGKEIRTDNDHYVHQVFCSAPSVSYSNNDIKLWEPFARLILNATYEAAFLATINLCSTKLFLTRVGGGVFGCCNSWIDDAIVRACKIFKHYPIQVILVDYYPCQNTKNILQRIEIK